jgi:putative transposase
LLVEQALKEYGFINEIITDHGTQFYAVNEGINEFQKCLASKGIKHILCRVKHPQSNGKTEIWFKIYKRFRQNFKTIQELINWYNNVRPHESLEHDMLLTPSEAFTLKQKPETLIKQAIQMLEKR